MGVPNVVYEYKSLRTLCVLFFAMNVAGCVIVVIMVIFALKLHVGVTDYLNVVAPGTGSFWPVITILAAIFCTPVYAIGVKLFFQLRYHVSGTDEHLNHVLFVHCMLCLTSLVLVVSIIVVGMIHATNFQNTTHHGILDSMREYANDLEIKAELDMMQLSFECCGSKSFKDWFYVRWMSTDPEGTGNKDQNGCFVSADVPFSCCEANIARPCIHNNIFDRSDAYLYEAGEGLTISTTGCQEKILNHVRYVSGILIFGLVLLAIYQMIVAVLSRLLQTAHSNTFYIGPKKNNYLTWIFGSMPSYEIYDQLIYGGKGIPAEEMLLVGEHSDANYPEPRDGSCCAGTDDTSKQTRCVRGQSPMNSKILDVDACSSPSLTICGGEKRRPSVCVLEGRARMPSCTNTIPTPPPSPSFTWDVSKCDVEKRHRQRCGSSNVVSVKSSDLWFDPRNTFCTRKEVARDMQRAGIGARSSSLSNDRDKYRRDSNEEEDESRIKKICKDISTEYKQSAHSKRRRDYSEFYRSKDFPRSRIRDATTNRTIRQQEICAKVNPTDTYSRFRGTVQDIAMRRPSRSQAVPPPLPIFDQLPKSRAACQPEAYRPRNEVFRNTSSPTHGQRQCHTDRLVERSSPCQSNVVQPRQTQAAQRHRGKPEISWDLLYPPPLPDHSSRSPRFLAHDPDGNRDRYSPISGPRNNRTTFSDRNDDDYPRCPRFDRVGRQIAQPPRFSGR